MIADLGNVLFVIPGKHMWFRPGVRESNGQRWVDVRRPLFKSQQSNLELLLQDSIETIWVASVVEFAQIYSECRQRIGEWRR